MMNNILLGRLTIQAYMTVGLIGELTDDDEDDFLSDAAAISGYGVSTAILWAPTLKPALVGAGTRAAARTAIAAGTRVGAVAARAASLVAPVALGYAAGALVGTAISKAIFGDEGAKTAMGFYSGGTLPGTEAPDLSKFQYIFKPTAPGGPRSLYDVAVDISAALPKFYNPTPGGML
jgi:hypothetical protein